MAIENNWLTEASLNKSVSQSFKIKNILHHSKSIYQDIKVIETFPLGRVLLLDDMAMISEKDEFIYHEVMVHLPVLTQEQTKNVLVIGAGDGGIIRELVKYSQIESITLVEIDEEVTRICKEFFPNVTTGFNDKRVQVIFQDGNTYIDELLKTSSTKYDLIISDSTDPEGIAENLYTKTFYDKIQFLLNDNGIFICQTETPFFDEYDIHKIYKNLRSTFHSVKPVCAPILIYPGVYWTFAFCTKKEIENTISQNKIHEYNLFKEDLKWHNEQWHMSAFVLPNFVKNKLNI